MTTPADLRALAQEISDVMNKRAEGKADPCFLDFSDRYINTMVWTFPRGLTRVRSGPREAYGPPEKPDPKDPPPTEHTTRWYHDALPGEVFQQPSAVAAALMARAAMMESNDGH